MPYDQANVLAYTSFRSVRPLAIWRESPQFVLCRRNKHPVKAAWQKQFPNRREIEHHISRGGLVGLIPESLGYVCFDVDAGAWEPLVELIESKTQASTIISRSKTPDHFHVFCRVNGKWPSGNAKWEWKGSSGDIRYDKGYVVLWNHHTLKWLHDNESPTIDFRIYNRIVKNSSEDEWNEGERNEKLNRELFNTIRHGGSIDEIVEKARRSGLDEDEINATVRSATTGAKKSLGGYKKVFPQISANAFKDVCKCEGLEIRYNIDKNRVEIKWKNEWEQWDNRQFNHFKTHVENNYAVQQGRKNKPLSFTNIAFEQYVDTMAEDNKVAPFIDWLKNLTVEEEEITLDNWLVELFGVKNTALNRWASKAMFVNTIYRALEPGNHLRTYVLLIGPAGVGKSSIIMNMLPTHLRDFFTDSFSFGFTEQKRVETLQGKFVVELAEMIGVHGRADSNKAFLSSSSDHMRLAYGRAAKDLPRRCNFIGTANPGMPLPSDMALALRFVPVVISKRAVDKPEEFMERFRDRLWAEAYHLYKNGERFTNVPQELEALQGKVIAPLQFEPNIDFISKIEEFERYLPDKEEIRTTLGHENRGSPVDWARLMQIELDSHSSKIRFGKHLSERPGWEKIKVHGQTQYRYKLI